MTDNNDIPLQDSRHEAFALGIAEGGEAKEVYIKIYPNCKSSSAKVCAYRLCKKIAPRITALKKQNEQISEFSRNDILKRLRELSTSAKYDSDKIKALELMAKMQGYMETKIDLKLDKIVPVFLSPDGTGINLNEDAENQND